MMRAFPFLLLLLVFLASCDGDDNNPSDNFDRSAMLSEYATKMIQPALSDLSSASQTLLNAVNLFVGAPTEANLENMQEKWSSAYQSWQSANSYNFGPAGEAGTRKGLIEEIGTFPVSSTKIEDRISSGVWNLNDFDRDARGFLAMEYLIFRRDNNNAAIVDALVNNNRRVYLKDLAIDIDTRIDLVKSSWSGDYLMLFVNNDGRLSDLGSSCRRCAGLASRGASFLCICGKKKEQ